MARRPRHRNGAPAEKCGTAVYFRRTGLVSSPVKPVTVRNASPFLPSGTVAVIVVSFAWVNFAGLPGPKDTMLTQPGWPKCAPVIVTWSPVLPSSGLIFLIFGISPAQLTPCVSRGDSEALALLL